MAIASYDTDLFTITEAESTTGVTAIGGGSSGLNQEQEYFIQNTACISKNGWNNTTPRGFVFDSGTAFSIDSGSAIFYWAIWAAPNALNNQSTGGIQFLAGVGSADFNGYYVKGADTYTYGGWFNIPVDPEFATADVTVGTPTAFTNWDSVGIRVIQNGNVTKGSPMGLDAVRHGRRLRIIDGDATAYGTFLSASIRNDEQNNRWGLFQAIDGGFLQQGIFQIGSSSAACDFRDSNRSISIANTEYVSPSFNRFEFVNTGTNVEWNTINIAALGTQSPGDFYIQDNITGSFDTCNFSNMGFFEARPNTTFTTNTWRNCKELTQSGSAIDDCTISAANTVAGDAFIISDDPANISNNTFNYSDGHAIEITTTGTYTFANNTFNNYLADNTSGSAVFNNSGGAVTLNVTAGGGAITVRNGGGSSTTINNNVSVTLTQMRDNTEVRVYADGTTTELAGIENATVGTTDNREFTFSLPAGTIVDIVIISIEYENQRIENFTIPISDSEQVIQQRFDRNYLNP